MRAGAGYRPVHWYNVAILDRGGTVLIRTRLRSTKKPALAGEPICPPRVEPRPGKSKPTVTCTRPASKSEAMLTADLPC